MKDRPSVLINGNFLSETSGVRGVCEDLAERLMKAGWTIVTTSTKPGRIARLLDMLKTIWIRRNEYQLASIDTFSSWSFVWAEIVTFVLRRMGKTYILTLHGGSLPDFAQRWPGRVTHLLTSAAAVIAPSRYLLEKMKPYRPDLLLVPNPIDLPIYPFNLRDNPRPILMWLRAFHNIYNPLLAIRVAASLVSQYPQFHLTMGGGDTGDGSFQNTKQLVEELGISNFVEIAGKITKAEVPAWLQKGEIFINTTNVDNTPVSVVEAMACGLPIVSTNVGGIPYLLENERDALLIPPDDVSAMTNAIARLLIEPGLSMKLAQNARCKVEQFDWSIVLPIWERIFQDVLIN